MALFDYICKTCGAEKEIEHSVKGTTEIKCEKCSSVMSRLITSSQFLIKGNTSSKLWQEERWRHKKNADLEIKQLERYGSGTRLAPNIGGTEFENWADAKKAASEAGLNGTSYDGFIDLEKRTKNSGKVDEIRWKRAKQNKAKA